MSGNASKEAMKEVKQIVEFIGSIGKAAALVALKMTVAQRQSWIGMPPEQFARVLANDVFVPWVPRWYEKQGVIYFKVTSDGTTGEKWIKRLEKKGFRIDHHAKSALRSPDFKPTSGVTTEIAVHRIILFEGSSHIISEFRSWAITEQKRSVPDPEVACLIRESFSDEDMETMGLTWIVPIHFTVEGSDGDRFLLSSDRQSGGRLLKTFSAIDHSNLNSYGGFALAVS